LLRCQRHHIRAPTTLHSVVEGQRTHALQVILLLLTLLSTACSGLIAAERPPAVDYALRRMMVLDDDDLPAELVHLVGDGPATQEYPPEHYTYEEWQWVMSTFTEYRDWYRRYDWSPWEEPPDPKSYLVLDSGNRVFYSEEAATEAYQLEADWVRSHLAEETWYDHIEHFPVPGVGDEAFGLVTHESWDKYPADSRWETEVMFRRGSVLGVVVMGRRVESEDSPVATDLAHRLDAKIIAALAGQITPEPADSYSRETGEVWYSDENPVAPTRQLASFAFDLETTYELPGAAVTLIISGVFQSPDRMRCDIETDPPSDVTTVFSVGNQFAVGNDEDGYRYLGPDDPLCAIVYTCPGSDAFFDSLYVSESDFGYWDSEAGAFVDPQPIVETISGIETRRYDTDDMAPSDLVASFGELEEIDAWFHAADGWPVRLSLRSLVDPDLMAGSSVQTNRDLVEMTMDLEISRPNDPSITVDIPEEITPAGSQA